MLNPLMGTPKIKILDIEKETNIFSLIEGKQYFLKEIVVEASTI